MTRLTEEEQNIVSDLERLETGLNLIVERAANLGMEIQHEAINLTRMGDLVKKEVHNFRAVKVLSGW